MKIVYTDLDGSAPRVKWQGATFLDGIPVEVPAGFRTEKIAGNPFFSIVAESEPGLEPTGTMELERRGPGRPPKAG